MMHSQGHAAMRFSVRLLLLSCLLLLVSACATPIGVARVDTQSVYRSLTASELSTGQPSATTEQVLVRTGLAQRFHDDPEATLAALRGTGVDLSRDRLFALAELSFVHAEDTRQPEYYLAAAVYAYAFLFPTAGTDRGVSLSPIDPRPRLAADLYNLGLTLGLSTPERDRVALAAGRQPLPFGTLTLAVDPEQFVWGGYRMTDFIPMAEFKLRGLRNRYRQPGVGVPLAAELSPIESGPAAEAARKRIPRASKCPSVPSCVSNMCQRALPRGTWMDGWSCTRRIRRPAWTLPRRRSRWSSSRARRWRTSSKAPRYGALKSAASYRLTGNPSPMGS